MTKGMTEGAVMGKRFPAGTYLIVVCKRVFRGIWVVCWEENVNVFQLQDNTPRFS